MKLQISYNFTDLNQALDIARKTVDYADILEIGPLLIYKEGINAIKQFKIQFPKKPIFANTKITASAQSAVNMFAQAGATLISILAGISQNTIKKASDEAKKIDAELVLDIIDIHNAGQFTLDAKHLGIDILLIHNPSSVIDPTEISSLWQSIAGNTRLPLYITDKINRENVHQILSLKPQGIAIGSAITKADNPHLEAQFFKSLLS
jgi:3-hexulose-6-phosphate synthase